MKHVLILLLTFLIAAQQPALTQKKFKIFQASEIKKGDLSDKAFKDFPTSSDRILFDYGTIEFTAKEKDFLIERTRYLRLKLLSDSSISAHQLGLTSFDEDEIISFDHYSLVDGDISKKDIKDNWYNINKYSSLASQISDLHPGDILELSFREKIESPADIPEWQFEYEIPVDYSEFYAEVPGMFVYRPLFKGYTPFALNSRELLKDKDQNWVEMDGFYVYQNRFICVDIAPFKNTVFSPSSKNYLTSINFYLEEIKAYKSYQEVQGQSWELLAKQLYKDPEVYGRVKDFNAKAYVERLELDSNKVSTLITVYNWVRSTFSWNGDIGISAEHSLDELIRTKSGSIAEINLLLCALLNEAGIYTYPVILKSIDQGEIDMEFPSASQFNYLIVWVDINGDQLVMDASDPCLEIGLLRPVCLNYKGLKVTPKFEEWVDLENNISAKMTMITVASISNGQLKGDMNISKQNYFAFEDCKSDGSIEELVQVDPGIVVSDFKLTNRDSIANGNKISFTCNADAYATLSGGTYTFSPFWANKIDESPFKDKERSYPVVFPYLFEYTWNFIFNLNDNSSISDYPKSEEIITPDKSIRFYYEAKKLDGMLHINAQFRILKRKFTVDTYPDILDFYSKMIDKMNEEVKIKVKH